MARKLLVLENSVIDSLLANNSVLEKFPFLAAIAKKLENAPVKRCCGGTKKASVNYNAIKSSLAAMSSAEQLLLKQLLNVEMISVRFKAGGNEISTSF